jgi:hypothetical protein
MKVSINIAYWHTSEDRLTALRFVLGKLSNFFFELKKENIDFSFTIFDFSETPKIEGGIHIPYPVSEYRRAEKLNHVIKYNCDNLCPDIFCLFDSDIFFDSESYQVIIELIKNFDKKFFYVGYIFDLIFKGQVQLDLKNIQLVGNFYPKKRDVFGLGGAFMIDFNELFDIGGYDENFITWGGEDDDLGNRLSRKGIKRKNLNARFYHLPHTHIQKIDWNQYKKQCELIMVHSTFKPSKIIFG